MEDQRGHLALAFSEPLFSPVFLDPLKRRGEFLVHIDIPAAARFGWLDAAVREGANFSPLSQSSFCNPCTPAGGADANPESRPETWRRILVGHARSGQAAKRGSGISLLAIDEAVAGSGPR